MGFLDYQNVTQNPAQRYYKWSGGRKPKINEDGTESEELELRGELSYWNGEQQENVVEKLPFRFCVLDDTRAITGFAPVGQNVRFYSNECPNYNEIMVVMRKEGEGVAEEVVRGPYAEVKEKLPQGAKLQMNLYIYNLDTKQIERMNLSGSSMSAWINFTKKAAKGAIYKNVIRMEAGTIQRRGTVEFIPPVFTVDRPYTDDDYKLVGEQAKELQVYTQYRTKMNTETNGEPQQPDFAVNQTPTMYAGEENQETGEAGEEILTDELPF